MSIERTQSSASEAARAREGTGEARERTPADPAQADRFRSALDGARQGVQQQSQQGQAEGGEPAGDEAGLVRTATEDAVHAARDGEREHGGHGQDGGDGEAKLLDPALLWQAQHALRGGGETAAAMPAPTGASTAVAELIERHVRKLAAGGSATGADGDGRVLLRMSDATLPGTDLLLSREGDGWVLRADSRSRESFDAIREAGPQLAQRFAERNLGTLTIDPHFHG